MSWLAAAIERRQWETAALVLMLGVTEAAAALPPEAVEGLLEVLDQTGQPARPAGPEDEERGSRGGRQAQA